MATAARALLVPIEKVPLMARRRLKPSRMFLSIPLPAVVIDDVHRARRWAENQFEPEGMQWTSSATYHVTLEHIGTVFHANRIEDRLRKLGTNPVLLTLRPELRAFPDGRALYMPVDGADELAELVRAAIAELYGEERAGHVVYPFRGHVTVGIGQFPDRILGRLPSNVAKERTWVAEAYHMVISHREPRYYQEHVRTIRL